MLDGILAGVREDVARRKAERPAEALEDEARGREAPPSLIAALQAGEGPRVIAEIKRASPSRGVIRGDLDPVEIAARYEEAGAVGISVLTEERRFRGSLDDLARVAATVRLPVLRKDFIVDRYQLLEARAAGASAVLLIARILSDAQLRSLLQGARDLGLEALVELHDERDAMRAFPLVPELVGVNNRNLDTLKVSLETSRRLAPYVASSGCRISESGIRRPGDMASLEAYGYHGFLVGEGLLDSDDPGEALRELLRDPAAPGRA